jgi:hypothetical protein
VWAIAPESYGGHPVAVPIRNNHHQQTMNSKVNRLAAKLEMDPRADTVAGTITGDDGVERRFTGWMEFASAIEAWRSEHGPDASEGTTEPAYRHQTEGRQATSTKASDWTKPPGRPGRASNRCRR